MKFTQKKAVVFIAAAFVLVSLYAKIFISDISWMKENLALMTHDEHYFIRIADLNVCLYVDQMNEQNVRAVKGIFFEYSTLLDLPIEILEVVRPNDCLYKYVFSDTFNMPLLSEFPLFSQAWADGSGTENVDPLRLGLNHIAFDEESDSILRLSVVRTDVFDFEKDADVELHRRATVQEIYHAVSYGSDIEFPIGNSDSPSSILEEYLLGEIEHQEFYNSDRYKMQFLEANVSGLCRKDVVSLLLLYSNEEEIWSPRGRIVPLLIGHAQSNAKYMAAFLSRDYPHILSNSLC